MNREKLPDDGITNTDFIFASSQLYTVFKTYVITTLDVPSFESSIPHETILH